MRILQFLVLTVLCLVWTGCSSPSSPSTKTNTNTNPPSSTTTSGKAIGYKSVDSLGHAYYVFLNADTVAKSFTADVDLSTAQVLVDQQTAGVTAIAAPVGVTVSGTLVTLAPGTSVVLKK